MRAYGAAEGIWSAAFCGGHRAFARWDPACFIVARGRNRTTDTRLRTAEIDPLLTFASARFRELRLGLLLLGSLASVFELPPVRRVLQCLDVLRERLFRLTLLHEHIAPYFQRIGPVRTAPVRVLELRPCVREIAVL